MRKNSTSSKPITKGVVKKNNASLSYTQWLAQLKQEVTQVRLQTTLQVNANMLLVYWYIGTQINQKIDTENWGAKVIDKIAKDLQKAFPEMTGFSVRNLKYMRQFAATYNDVSIGQQAAAQLKLKQKNLIGQQVAAQLDKGLNALSAIFIKKSIALIPWGHHILLLDKINDAEERDWYIQKILENNWSRNVLLNQLNSNLYRRQAKNKKNTNFHLTLPKEQCDLANQIIKDPYKFEFLQLNEEATEREMEQQLVHHIQAFLLELGAGFAFVGRQYKLNIGKKDYIFDLLFYHLELRSFVVIELKMGAFEASFAGQMNAYINATNKLLKRKDDNPTIGIILCSEKDEIDVEFSIENLNHPIGVSNYDIVNVLPKAFKNKLPSAKQLRETIKEFNKKLKK